MHPTLTRGAVDEEAEKKRAAEIEAAKKRAEIEAKNREAKERAEKQRAKIEAAKRKWLRYRDLEERGIVRNRVQLEHMISRYGFPAGRRITPCTRVWTTDEIDQWFETRPSEPAPARGIVKALKEAKAARLAALDARLAALPNSVPDETDSRDPSDGG